MHNRIHRTIISVSCLVFFFAGTAFAKTKQIDVLYSATVGKTLKLKPGKYRIDVVNNQKSPAVKFFDNYGKLVGQAPVKVVNESMKNHQTQVDYYTMASNDHAITEISPQGWKEKLY
ncbi:MAG TPA: hypothetical protein VNM47_01775, partial [Terriglobia bacterium]|nr:hypothetical protein [Terriglobia bacterium]